MRVLIVSAFWPTRSNPITGIFIVQQVQAYVEAGCEVTVIVPQTIRGRKNSRDYHQNIANADVFCPFFPDVPQSVSGSELAIRFNALSCGWAILRTLRRHKIDERFDGIHIHEVRYGGLSYARWGQQRPAPAILTLHGVDPFVEERAAIPWFAGGLKGLWHVLAGVTLVGSPLSSYARQLGVPPEKCSIVHNGSKLPERWHSDQRPLSERRVVVSVSNLVTLKGIDLNLKALAQIYRDSPAVNWEYRIVGDGPERESLEMLAKALKIADRVIFRGRLSHDETLTEIANGDIFSLPSWGENFGIVYLEAMGRGRPVIGCRGWGAAEMVRDGTDGILVEPRDQASLQVALARLLTDPDASKNMGIAAGERALGFSWGENVRRYLELFARAGGRSHSNNGSSEGER